MVIFGLFYVPTDLEGGGGLKNMFEPMRNVHHSNNNFYGLNLLFFVQYSRNIPKFQKYSVFVNSPLDITVIVH